MCKLVIIILKLHYLGHVTRILIIIIIIIITQETIEVL